MSQKNRDRRERNRLLKILVPHPDSPEYSLETLRRMAAVKAMPGVNRVAIYHEQFCALALRRGARKCLCRPDIKVLDPDNLTEERDRRAWESHWMNEGGSHD